MSRKERVKPVVQPKIKTAECPVCKRRTNLLPATGGLVKHRGDFVQICPGSGTKPKPKASPQPKPKPQRTPKPAPAKGEISAATRAIIRKSEQLERDQRQRAAEDSGGGRSSVRTVSGGLPTLGKNSH